MYGHRPPSAHIQHPQQQQQQQQQQMPRFFELLEALRLEYEALQQDLNIYKLQREDFEAKMQGQLGEVGAMQKSVVELERAHLRLRQQFSASAASPEESGCGGASAAMRIQFPNLDGEIAAFGSGTNLAAMADGGRALPTSPTLASSEHVNGHHMASLLQKRVGGHDDDLARNVRPRDDAIVSVLPLPSRRSSVPGATPTTPSRKAGDGKGDYDWLVVYNPKTPRALTIDLLYNLGHESVVCCVKFSWDGSWLASGGNRTVNVYKVKTGEKVCALKDSALPPPPTPGADAATVDQYVRSVAFSPDGKWLASGSEDRAVRIWNLETKALAFKMAGHEQDVYSVEFLPSGAHLASGSGDKTVKIWEVASGKLVKTFEASSSDGSKDAGITSIAVSPSGKFVAAGSLDKVIRIWEIDSGALVETLEGHRDSVYSVAFSADGLSLISGSLDKTIKQWDFADPSNLVNATCRFTILGHKDYVLSVASSEAGHGRWIVSGSKDRAVQFWDRRGETAQLMLQGHKNSVISVAVSPVSASVEEGKEVRMFATASGDMRARIWSFTTLESASSDPPLHS